MTNEKERKCSDNALFFCLFSPNLSNSISNGGK